MIQRTANEIWVHVHMESYEIIMESIVIGKNAMAIGKTQRTL